MVVPQIEEIDDSKIYKNKIEDDLDVSFKFCFIGAGQAGSRIAQTFNKLGYNRVAVINTAEQDLNSIDLEHKLCISDGGAGKQPELAREKFMENVMKTALSEKFSERDEKNFIYGDMSKLEGKDKTDFFKKA